LQSDFEIDMLRVPFVDKSDSPVDGSTLSRRSRFLAAALGAGLFAVLAVASLLPPDPRGLGTHQQLGLPPCTFLTVMGIRCPACGMTTAWANVMHGRPVEALRASASGTLLAAVAIACGSGALAIAIRGKWLAWQPAETTIAIVAVGLATIVIVEWAFRVWGPWSVS
jgi:hypothetical protein